MKVYVAYITIDFDIIEEEANNPVDIDFDNPVFHCIGFKSKRKAANWCRSLNQKKEKLLWGIKKDGSPMKYSHADYEEVEVVE